MLVSEPKVGNRRTLPPSMWDPILYNERGKAWLKTKTVEE